MRQSAISFLIFLACTATLSSKDKRAKVTFQEMALGMRDAFNCGVVVEQYLHGSLKGKTDEYHAKRDKYNCERVENVLNTLPEQPADESSQ